MDGREGNELQLAVSGCWASQGMGVTFTLTSPLCASALILVSDVKCIHVMGALASCHRCHGGSPDAVDDACELALLSLPILSR